MNSTAFAGFQQWFDTAHAVTDGSSGWALSNVIAVVVPVLSAVGLYLNRAKPKSYPVNSYDFVDENGERIKEIESNTRFSRFLKGRELSDQGKALAGDKPYLVRNGNMRELVIWAPEHVQEFHRKDAKDHFKPFDMNMGHYAWQLLGECLGQQAGQKWKGMRAHMDPEFSVASANRMAPVFLKDITEWVDSMAEGSESASNAANTKPGHDTAFTQNIIVKCKSLVLGLIAKSVYGEAWKDDKLPALKTLNSSHDILLAIAFIGSRTISRWYNYLPTPETYFMWSFQRKWKAFNLSIIKHARENNLNCPAERIYRAVDQTKEMSMTEYLQTVDEMIFTNIDISGLILAFIFQNLAKDHSFQKKLRQEIQSNVSLADQSAVPSGQAGADKDLIKYIARSDSLLQYTILESMRVTPSMYFSLPECTGSPKRIASYTIPANTPTIIDVHRLNTNPRVWATPEYADPTTFHPERFLTLDPTRYRFSFVKWGIGRDKCLGKNVADLFLKGAVIEVLSRYEVEEVKLGAEIGVVEEKEKKKDGFTVGGEGKVVFRSIAS